MSRRRRDPFGLLSRVFQHRSVRPASDREVDEEIGYHLDRSEQELIAAGLPPDRARAEAARRFGDLDRHRANLNRLSDGRGRIERLRAFFESVVELIRGAFRALRGAPVASATVVATLALGIGANATMFGIVDRLLLSPPPHIVDADRVVRLYVQRAFIDRTIITQTVSHPDVVDWTAASSFSHVAAFSGARITAGSGTAAEKVNGARADPAFFPLLGVRPELGRFYTADEDVTGNATVAVLGYDYWRRRFGSDPLVVGERIQLGGVEHAIVGVAPPGFTGVDLRRVDVWVPLRAPVNRSVPAMWEGSRGWYFFETVARLAPGVSLSQAEAEATALHRAGRRVDPEASDYYESAYDSEARVLAGSVIAARAPRSNARISDADIARWLAGVSAIVLLIACANVANILMGVGEARRREVGVRLALGISSRRLALGFLVESLVLAVLGGGVALVVARFGSTAIRALLLPNVHWGSAVVDLRVLAYTAMVALPTGIVVGLLPAMHAARIDVARILGGGVRRGSRGPSRARTTMLVAQVTLTITLLVGAGLFVRSLALVRNIDLGFVPENLYLISPELDDAAVAPGEGMEIFGRARERLLRLPTVSAAALAVSAPFHSSMSVDIDVPDVPDPPVFSNGGPYIITVGTDYLETLGVRILEGRGFTDTDQEGSDPVVVVGAAMARAYWPAGDALGRCIKIGGTEEPCSTVVGVAADPAQQSLVPEDNAQYFVPLAQRATDDFWFSAGLLLVRADETDAGDVVALLARETQAIDSRIRFATVQPYRDLIDPQARSWRLGAALFSAFGLLALIIAAVGLYAVLAFNVAQRTHEIGVRSALGAEPLRIVRLVVGQSSRVVALSVLGGLAITVAAGSWLEPLLYGVGPRDPLVLGGVALVLVAVAIAAAAAPAARAARVDPVRALRAS